MTSGHILLEKNYNMPNYILMYNSSFRMQNTAKFYLVRRQQNNKGWKKRWVVFDGHELRYYKDKVNQ